MIIPTKHQNLDLNPMVLGADILFIIRNKDLTLEELYQELKKQINLNLDLYYDTLTYLWLLNSIDLNKNKISKKTSVSKKDIF
ncbi:ABC-three component system middle component 6 [Flagellimonas yonaguniensis]|uniref:ABC-three component system middle component 6 n=1 Tax=Flagellimonas yonaguniensis TaxID=3031325 RepID=UPI003AAE6009